MLRSPRKSITSAAVAVTVAAAVISAFTLAIYEQGSLARIGSEGRAMSRFGAPKTTALGHDAAAVGTDAGRDAHSRRSGLQN